MIFFLAAVQSPPRSTCNFFLLARVQFPPRVIRVKGDRYCIFALFKDTNNFCKPLGEKSTKKLTQKVTFTYFKNYSGFIMEPIDNQRHLCPLGNGRKCLSKCLICNLMKPRGSRMRVKKFLWAKIVLENIAHFSVVRAAATLQLFLHALPGFNSHPRHTCKT